MNILKNNNANHSKVHLIVSSIAALASAVYLTKDTGVPGENIHALEQNVGYWDLLSKIP